MRAEGIEGARRSRRLRTTEANPKVLFADPHSPWQRSTSENTNGVLRQYFPELRFGIVGDSPRSAQSLRSAVLGTVTTTRWQRR